MIGMMEKAIGRDSPRLLHVVCNHHIHPTNSHSDKVKGS